MKYSELHYERIDVDVSRKLMQGMVERLNSASTFDEHLKVCLLYTSDAADDL